MAQDPAQSARPVIAQVPRVEDLPLVPGGGFEEEAVRNAFDTFRRSMLQLHAQLRVLQAAGRGGQPEPVGHAVRMDALRLIRAAAEFADVLERDAQTASAEQFGRVEEEVRRRHRDVQNQEAQLDVKRLDTERECLELVNAARADARELRLNAEREAEALTRDAEARGARLMEQSRHQATELTNAARADVSQTLDWARAQASAIVARAQHGAEQLLGAAGLGPEAVGQIVNAIIESARASAMQQRPQAPPEPERRPEPPAPGPQPGRAPEPQGDVPRLEPVETPPPAPVTPPPSAPPPPPSTPAGGSEPEASAGAHLPPQASAFGVPFGTPVDRALGDLGSDPPQSPFPSA